MEKNERRELGADDEGAGMRLSEDQHRGDTEPANTPAGSGCSLRRRPLRNHPRSRSCTDIGLGPSPDRAGAGPQASRDREQIAHRLTGDPGQPSVLQFPAPHHRHRRSVRHVIVVADTSPTPQVSRSAPASASTSHPPSTATERLSAAIAEIAEIRPSSSRPRAC